MFKNKVEMYVCRLVDNKLNNILNKTTLKFSFKLLILKISITLVRIFMAKPSIILTPRNQKKMFSHLKIIDFLG